MWTPVLNLFFPRLLVISMLHSNQWEFVRFLPHLNSLQNYSLDHSFFWKLFSSPLSWNSFALCFIFLLSEHFLPLFSFLGPLTPAACFGCDAQGSQSAPFSSHHYIHFLIGWSHPHPWLWKWCIYPHLPSVQPHLWSLISHLTSKWRNNCLFCLDIPGASKCNFC